MIIVDDAYLTSPTRDKVYERIGKLPVDKVVEALQQNQPLCLSNGVDLGILNSRMLTYAYQQCCSYTKVPVSYFAIERCFNQPANPNNLNAAHQYHLNAYALIDGVEVMVNSDHIIPKSKSGVDGAVNRQPMLQWANTAKGNTIFVEDIELADTRGVWDLVAEGKGQELRTELLATAKLLTEDYVLDALKRRYIEYRIGDRVKPRKGPLEDLKRVSYNSGLIEEIKGDHYYNAQALVLGKWYPVVDLRKVFSTC